MLNGMLIMFEAYFAKNQLEFRVFSTHPINLELAPRFDCISSSVLWVGNKIIFKYFMYSLHPL